MEDVCRGEANIGLKTAENESGGDTSLNVFLSGVVVSVNFGIR